MPNDKVSAFVAIWDKNLGAKIKEYYPKSIKLDLELVATQIFIAFQTIFFTDNEENYEIKRTFFKLPIKNINRKAIIFLDLYQESEINEISQPYILVFLFPDYVTNESLNKFDKIIYNTGADLFDLSSPIEKHFNEINELFLLEEQIQDSQLTINEKYSFNDALLDFKNGMEHFSKGMYEQAYVLLRNAHLKFNSENKVELILETSFFLGSVLSQLNKFKTAQQYFLDLEVLSKQLNHRKYYENAIFMESFLAFKREDFEGALKNFEKLESEEIQFINKFNYYFLYGRVLRFSGMSSKAINLLLKALEFSSKLEETNVNKEKKAKLLLELGHTHYSMSINIVKTGKIEEEIFNKYLRETIKYYIESIDFWQQISNYNGLIQTYRLIGNVYELIEERENAIVNYRNALKNAELSSDTLNRLQIFSLIIQNLEKLDRHQEIVKEIDKFLSDIIPFAFIDLNTISSFHSQIGESLYKLGKRKEALSELLISLNIYNKFETPHSDGLKVLSTIIEIYKSLEEQKYVKYYDDQYNNLKDKIQNMEAKREATFELLRDIKEIWIFNIEGKELFSYAPETKVDPLLFGSFMSALQSFSKELTSKYMRSLTLGSSQYIFFKKETLPFFILGRANINTSFSLIENNLKILYEEFYNRYQSIIDQSIIEVSRFRDFINILENLNKKT